MGAIAAKGAYIPNFERVVPDPEWRAVFREIGACSYSRNLVTVGSEDLVIDYEILHLLETIGLVWNVQPSYPKHLPKTLKAESRQAGKVFSSLVNLVIGVWGRNKCGYTHPAFWFRDVYLEQEATAPFLIKDLKANSPKDTTLGKNKVVELMKNQNQLLRSGEAEFTNPFSQPATKKLFDWARFYAEQGWGNDGFYKGVYIPFLEARVEARKWWEKNGVLYFIHEKKAYFSAQREGVKPATVLASTRKISTF